MLATTPAAGAVNVIAATLVAIRFTEAMDPTSVTVTLTPTVNLGTPVWTSTNSFVTFTPVQALSPGTTYTVAVAGRDVAGNTLPAFSMTFATVDPIPPTVVSTTPTQGAADVSLSTSIAVQFSEAILPGSFTISAARVTAGPGTPVRFNAPTFSAGNTQLIVTQMASMQSNVDYRITINANDLAGNPMAMPYTFTFTTELVDTTPPSLTSSLPASGATGVPTNARLTLAFNEPMNAGSLVVTTTPSLAQGTPVITGNGQVFTYAGRVSDWAPNTAYQGSVSGTDVSGNALAATSFGFTTGAGPDTVRPILNGYTPWLVGIVPTNTLIKLHFSEPMNRATVEAALSATGGSSSVVCTFIWTSDSDVTCEPSAPLAPSTMYSLTVASGASDLNGNSVAASFTWVFTTSAGPDTTAPSVTATTPATTQGLGSPGTVGAAIDTSSIVVQFSDSVDAYEAGLSFQILAPAAAQGGTVGFDTPWTRLVYTFPAGYTPPPGTVFEFAVTATNFAGDSVSINRFFRLRQRATVSLYACGTNANCTIAAPMALHGYILATSACGSTSVTQGSLYAGDQADDRIYRSFLNFDMRPLDDSTTYPNLLIENAVLNVHQSFCFGAPYSSIVNQTRYARVSPVDYGQVLGVGACTTQAISNGVNLTPLTDTTSDLKKTAIITASLLTQFSGRVALSNRAQYQLRATAHQALGSADFCEFGSHASLVLTQRPYIETTFQFD